MSKKRDDKRGSNRDGSTSPADVAAIVGKARRDAKKKRHKRGDKREAT